MTTTTENPTVNLVEATIARNPQLQNYGNLNLRNFIAAQMVANEIPFEEAEKQVLSLLMGARSMEQELKEKFEAQRKEFETQFDNTLKDVILSVAKDMKDKLPQGGVRIWIDPSREYKNSDGSPMMDASNNPIRDTFVEIEYVWEPRKRSSTANTGSPVADGRGRPEGDYIFGDKNYASMRAFIRDGLNIADAEFSAANQSTRAFLESKGYEIPTEPVADAEGKKHTTITLKAA